MAEIDDKVIVQIATLTVARLTPVGNKQGVIGYDLSRTDPTIIDFAINKATTANKLPLAEGERLQSLHNRVQDEIDRYNINVPKLNEKAPSNVSSDASRFLMVSPDALLNYQSPEQAVMTYARWEATRHALASAGAHVEVINGRNKAGGPRETFDRDTFVTIGKTAFFPDVEKGRKMGLDAPEETLRDQQQAKEYLQKNGFKIVDVKDAWFEGGNTIIHDASHTVMLGIEPTGNSESAQKLIEEINQGKSNNERWNILGVPLNDHPDFYHLDLGMSRPLSRGEVIIYPGVTDPDTYKTIKEKIGEKNIIEIDRQTARLGAANLNYAGNTLVMPEDTPALKKQLEDKGYKTVTGKDYGLGSLIIGNNAIAGPHCITNEIGMASAPAIVPGAKPAIP